MGCDGGVPMYAYKYIKEVGGVVSADKCPYSSYYNTVADCETTTVADYKVPKLTINCRYIYDYLLFLFDVFDISLFFILL